MIEYFGLDFFAYFGIGMLAFIFMLLIDVWAYKVTLLDTDLNSFKYKNKAVIREDDRL